MKQANLEGKIYRETFKLINDNHDLLLRAKPKVSKNSAGYSLWNVFDKEKDVFDLTKLWVGAQGTLGVMIEADLRLVPVHKHREMMIIFLHDLSHLGQIINEILPLEPESFESYDDNTLKLALRFFPQFQKLLGTRGIIQTGVSFLPEFLTVLFGGIPKLVLQVDFTGDDPNILKQKIASLRQKLKPLHPQTRIALENQENKYWLIRRESFNLLRQKIHDKHTAPFIDDIVVAPKNLPEFLPKLDAILKQYPQFLSTVAGHVGDGNFHIIPLADLKNEKVRKAIPELAEKVYGLVLSYNGSITGEHNDGLIRSPFLKQMYGEKVYGLFEETKKIFDPEGIFNPGKKTNADLSFAMDHIRVNW